MPAATNTITPPPPADNNQESSACPVCSSNQLNLVLTLENIAASANVAYHSADEAKHAPKGDLNLVQCQECGFMWNLAFDIKLVAYHNYTWSAQYSPAFQKYLDFLASYLQKNYQNSSCKTHRNRLWRCTCALYTCQGDRFQGHWLRAKLCETQVEFAR